MALLPGSRNSELKQLANTYLQTAILCQAVHPRLKLVMPVVSSEHEEYINKLLGKFKTNLPLQIVIGDTYSAIAASNIVLVTSGTATLEVMLHKKPMIIAYKTGLLTYEIVKRLIKVPYIGLPNLLAAKKIVPEFIQQQATPKLLSHALLNLLSSVQEQNKQISQFQQLHNQLRQNSSATAVAAIEELLGLPGAAKPNFRGKRATTVLKSVK